VTGHWGRAIRGVAVGVSCHRAGVVETLGSWHWRDKAGLGVYDMALRGVTLTGGVSLEGGVEIALESWCRQRENGWRKKTQDKSL